MRRKEGYIEDQWVIALANGSEEGLTAVYQSLYPALCWYSSKITADRPSSEDIVQEAFLKIWEKRAIFTTWLGIRAYLYTMVRRDSIHWLHGRDATNQKQSDLPNTIEDSTTRLDDIIRVEVYRQLQDTVRKLPTQCRQVVTLLFMEGKSTRQVSEELEISQANVKVQKGRGLKLLRHRLPDVSLYLLAAIAFLLTC